MFKTRDFLPVIITAFVVFVLAIAGLAEANACVGDWSCWLMDPFKILFGQFTPPPNPPFLLNLAQQGGRVVLLVGAFLSTVRVFVSAARHDFRLARARKMKDHIIVCGLGETGMQIARNMRSAGQKVVVIDRADDTVNAAACDQQGIPVIRGDATNSDVLALAGVVHAREIAVCAGDDATNMDVALHIKNLVSNGRKPRSRALVVHTEMRDQWLFSRLIDHDRQTLGSHDVDLRLFNTFENAARLLLKLLRLPPGPEIEGGAFVIVGFGNLGHQIILHLIRAAPAPLGIKTRIIVIDQLAEQKRVQFSETYPAVAEFADVSFVEAKISPDNPQVWSTVEKIVRDLPLLGIAICFTDDQTGLYAGLNMRRLLDNCSRIHVPVFVRLGQHRHLGQFAAAMEGMPGPQARLQVFGGLEELLSPDILIREKLDTLARAIHAQYRDSRQTIDRTYPGDKPWEMLPEALKKSNRRRADNMPIQLAQAGLHIVASAAPAPLQLTPHEIELLARLEHRRWVIERRLLGVSYGEVRSDFPPRNELLVDWEKLPEVERARNRADFKTLPKVLSEANFEVRRHHKILAIDAMPGTAVSKLQSAITNKEKGCVVIADVDSTEGHKAAEIALKLPDVALWVVSRDYPRQFHDKSSLMAIWEGAEGWVTREQFRGS